MPRAIRIFEAIYRVTQQGGVSRIENRILIVTLAGGRAVGKKLVKVSVADVAKDRIVMCGVNARCGAPKFSNQNQRRPRNSHVVHGLVVAAFRSDNLRNVEHIGQTSFHTGAPRLTKLVAIGVTLKSRGRESN